MTFRSSPAEAHRVSQRLPCILIKPRDLSSWFHEKSQSTIGEKQFGVLLSGWAEDEPCSPPQRFPTNMVEELYAAKCLGEIQKLNFNWRKVSWFLGVCYSKSLGFESIAEIMSRQNALSLYLKWVINVVLNLKWFLVLELSSDSVLILLINL